MNELFKKAMETNEQVMKVSGKLDIISIDVNATMKAYLEAPNPSPNFLAQRYVELAYDLYKYGLIEKQWGEK